MYNVSFASGKSRIIHCAALHALLNGRQKVHIVTCTQSLAEREQSEFTEYFKPYNLQDRVAWHYTIDFASDRNDLLIIDEADWILGMNPLAFFELINRDSAVLCFSGSKLGSHDVS